MLYKIFSGKFFFPTDPSKKNPRELQETTIYFFSALLAWISMLGSTKMYHGAIFAHFITCTTNDFGNTIENQCDFLCKI